MQHKSRAIGMAIVLGTFWAGMMLVPGGKFAAFIDYQSLALLLGLVAGGLIWAFPTDLLLDAFRKGLSSYQETNREVLTRNQAILNRAYSLAWGSGIILTLIPLVSALRNMGNPERVGPAMSVAILSLLYAVFLAEVVLKTMQQGMLVRARVEVPASKSPASVDSLGVAKSMMGTGIAVLLLVMLQFVAVTYGGRTADDEMQARRPNVQRSGALIFFAPGPDNAAAARKDNDPPPDARRTAHSTHAISETTLR